MPETVPVQGPHVVESSWILIKKDPEMKLKYQRIKNQRGGKRAIVAVARNLSYRIRRMLLAPCTL